MGHEIETPQALDAESLLIEYQIDIESEIEYQVQRVIIQARIAEGLSQKELAERTDIAQSNISAMERGSRMPSVKTLQKLAEGLGKKLRIEMV